jgi:hypothetical protein
VPIGETLAQARHQAGLTVAQVSKQTRIRETIIREIEADDYSECGGDFYTRGHIRAIAKVVGADPEPLVQEYDTLFRAPGVAGTVSLQELLAASGRAGQRRPPDLPAVRAAAAGESVRRTVTPAAATRWMGPPRRARRHTVKWAVFVGLALAVVALGFVALHRLAGAPPRPAPAAAGEHAATGHNAGHGRPGPAVNASHPAAPSAAPKTGHSAAPAPARPGAAQRLSPVRATAFGPHGGDNPQLAHLVLGHRHAAGWRTDWYTSARFGNLYRGTGLLLDMGHRVAITSARVNLGHVRGASFQLRVGRRPAMGGLRPVAHASGAGGVVRLHLARPARGRYVLVWFTRLPMDRSGTFQARVYHVSLMGRP